MRIKVQTAILLNLVSLAACSQIPDKNKRPTTEKKRIEESYAPIDFLKSMWNIHADTLGIIKAETWYKNVGNNAGNAYIYIMHKNGTKWWYEEAKKRFPNVDAPLSRRGYYAVVDIADILLKEDSVTLKNYDKWAFFIDKKYLEPIISTSGESGGAATDYYPKSNTAIEIILYEQKAGSNKWIEIERKKFQTDKDGGAIYDDKGWELNFIRQKVKESNEKK